MTLWRTERRSSDQWRETGEASSMRQEDDHGPFVRQDEHDLTTRQRDDDEQSELSFSSAFGTLRHNLNPFNQHRETSV